ncbi:MAG TPA: hypothetical protein PLS53_00305 [Thermoanaerobaculaceae bacterium]|nr:hypothetical protein [Thermoanaerobaculaceae bacterium]HPS76575.1 hypothetical protein [Thermoanaerobaculaceae bacterium]
MSQEDIMKDLDSMIKKAADIKADALKKSAAPGGDLSTDNGTQAPSTGTHFDKNVEEAGKHTAAKVDGGAEANKPGASVEMSTDGATAVATDGKSGAKGADLEVKKDAANGAVPASELSKTSAALDKVASEWIAHGKLVSAGLAKVAAELPVDEDAAKATAKLAGILGKSEGQAITAGDLTSFDRFLAKKAAEQGLGGGEEVGQAQAGAGDLMQRLQSGQVSEEEAAKILTEAAQSGALSEQDLAELQQLVEAQGGAGGGDPAAAAAAGGDPAAAAAGGAPPAPMDPAAMGGAPPAGPDGMIQDPGLEAKVAALHIGPDHPDYGKKLAHFHKEALQFGYDLAIKTAQEVLALEEALEQEKGEKGEGEGDKKGEKHDEGGEGHKEPDADNAGAGAPPAPPAAPGGQPDQAAVVDAMTGAGAPPAAPGAPAGPGALPPMPGAPPAAPGGAMDPGAAGSIPVPKTPEEAAALQQLLAELGIQPEDLAKLQQADVKVAAEHEFSFKARHAILGKVAALRIAATTNTNKGK